MGLDMYLNEKEYLSKYDDPERLAAIAAATGRDDVREIVYEVGYWRKANHIHNWFVQKHQEGADDCGEYWIPVDGLEDLYDTCIKVLVHRDNGNGEETAKNLLPPTSGFFFGGTDIDDFYYSDCQKTVDIIDSLRKEDGSLSGSYYYQSSW